MRDAWTVFQKEARETLRDWRTLLMMVALPVLLYPVILVVVEQLAVVGKGRVEAEPARVAFAGEPAPELVAFVDADSQIVVVSGASGAAAVRDGVAEAVARVAPTADDAATIEVAVVYDETEDRSRRAFGVLQARLELWGDTVLRRRLAEHRLPAGFATPVTVEGESLARPEELGGYWLGRFLPLLLIVITLLGAFYPAIDLAAGEKERGTLETLMTAPLPASRIVAGKFMTVAAVGLVAAALNLASMLLTYQAGLFQLPAELGIEVALPAGAIAVIFLALVPLAVLFGAVFLGLAVRAQSFKEAQNALTPVYMAVLLPAMLPLMPGIEFSPMLALVPVAGVALLFRELMSGDAALLPSLLVLGSTAVYAGLALAFAANAFGREDVLFGGAGRAEAPGGGWRAWLERLRAAAGRVPTLGQALLVVAATAALGFYVGRALTVRFQLTGLIAGEWLTLLLPAVLFVVLGGYDTRRALALRRPSGTQLLAAVLLIAGGLPIAWYLAWFQSLFIELPTELLGAVEQMLRVESLERFLLILFAVAITPAICEEVVFRGVLLSSSRGTLSGGRAVVLNALLFGVFHVSTETVFRLLPTAWLGLLLAWAVWRTRSLYVSALMHFLNNATIAALVAAPTAAEWLVGIDKPPWFLAPFALASLGAGAWLMAGATGGESDPEATSAGMPSAATPA